MELNHTVVRSHDKEASARFFAEMMGLKYEGLDGHFAPVRVNDQLTMDFDNSDQVVHAHYAFKVSDAEFEDIFDRVKAAGIQYSSGPGGHWDMQINTRKGGRGFYFPDPNGHSIEVLTR